MLHQYYCVWQGVGVWIPPLSWNDCAYACRGKREMSMWDFFFFFFFFFVWTGGIFSI